MTSKGALDGWPVTLALRAMRPSGESSPRAGIFRSKHECASVQDSVAKEGKRKEVLHCHL